MPHVTTAITGLLSQAWRSRPTRRRGGVVKILAAITALFLSPMILFGTGTGFFHPRPTQQLLLNHSYVLNARHACRMPHRRAAGPDLLILVLTTASHRQQRDAIRETYGSLARDKPWPGLARGLGVNTLNISRRALLKVEDRQKKAGTAASKTRRDDVPQQERRRDSGNEHTMRLVFLLGQTETASPQQSRALQLESMQFGDLVQWEGLQEDYSHLTYKVLLGLRWVRQFCSSAGFVAKVDDDTFVHVPRLFKYLQGRGVPSLLHTRPGRQHDDHASPPVTLQAGQDPAADAGTEGTPWSQAATAASGVHKGSDVKDGVHADSNVHDDENIIYGEVCGLFCQTQRRGKYAVSFSAFPFVFYPTYTVGNFYLMSTSLAFRILCVSERLPYLSMEDVFVTGILGYVVGARHHGLTPAQLDKTLHRLDYQSEEKIASLEVPLQGFPVIWKSVMNLSEKVGH